MLQETEMREFFNRIIGDFTGLTEAANKVEGLQLAMEQMNLRLISLEEENNRLKSEIKEAWDYARTVEDRANGLQNALSDSQASAKSLQETIVMSDSRVQELTHNVEATTLNFHQAVRERDEARNTAKDYEIYNADLKQQLSEMVRERDYWQSIAKTHEVTIKSLTETVSRVQSILNPPSENVEHFPQFNVG